MIDVSASILSANLGQLGQEAAHLEAVGCTSIHVDVMDGVYVPNLTFGAMIIPTLQSNCSLPIDVHLMVQRPETHLVAFALAGVRTISFHPETTFHPHRLIQAIRAQGIAPGLVLNPGFSFEPIAPLLHDVERVLIMTVNPGFGGQSFIASQLETIRALRAYLGAHKLCVTVGVDGGVNLETAPLCAQVGASLFVTGHALFTAPDRAAFVSQLRGLRGPCAHA